MSTPDATPGPGPEPPPDDASPLAQLAEVIREVAYREAKRRLRGGLAAREDASDIAQSVAREILEDAHALEYQGMAALRALIKRVVEHKLVEKTRYHVASKRDARRVVALEPTEGEEAPAVEPRAAGPGPATVTIDRDLLAIGMARLQELPERQRQVVELRMTGKSHKEISAALGISVVNSERLLSDAKKQLRLE